MSVVKIDYIIYGWYMPYEVGNKIEDRKSLMKLREEKIDLGIRILWQVEELESGKTRFIFLPEGSYEVVDEDKIKGMLAGKQTGII